VNPLHHPFRFLAILAVVCLAAIALSAPSASRPAKMVNVADYGAIPNDGKDDTAAFQAALDAWHRVYIPGGGAANDQPALDYLFTTTPPSASVAVYNLQPFTFSNGPTEDYFVGGTSAPIIVCPPGTSTDLEFGAHFYHCLFLFPAL